MMGEDSRARRKKWGDRRPSGCTRLMNHLNNRTISDTIINTMGQEEEMYIYICILCKIQMFNFCWHPINSLVTGWRFGWVIVSSIIALSTRPVACHWNSLWSHSKNLLLLRLYFVPVEFYFTSYFLNKLEEEASSVIIPPWLWKYCLV